MLAALLCAASVLPLGRRAVHLAASVPSRPTFDFSLLAAALPSVLTPPPMQPGVRLVSMIAEDIDADGDLDVVANDGSLELIVWTNDGSGRLSRREGHDVAGLRPEPAAPGLADGVALPDSIAPPTFASLEIHPRPRSITPEPSPLWPHRSGAALLTACVLSRTPRGPPAPRLLT
jgi:hypothetical protein